LFLQVRAPPCPLVILVLGTRTHEFACHKPTPPDETRDGVDGPRTASMCQNEVVADLNRREPSMEKLIRIGMDTSKSVFQLHGVDVREQPMLKKKLRRSQVVPFFSKLAPTLIAIEA
jgi:hypothetical protein